MEGLSALKEALNRNERRVDAVSKTGLEIWAALVTAHAKANHQRGKGLSLQERTEHSDDRFYVWTNILVNSIAQGDVHYDPMGAEIEVMATADYAAAVELGGPNRRAFPFMTPALDANKGAGLTIMENLLRMVFV